MTIVFETVKSELTAEAAKWTIKIASCNFSGLSWRYCEQLQKSLAEKEAAHMHA